MANRRLKSLFYSYNHTPLVFVGVLFVLTFFSGFALTSERVSADTSGVVDLSMEVPAACSLTVTQGAVLTKTINSGDSDTIGTSTIKSVCNDSGGLAVYAVGYTNDSYGNTNLTASDGGNTYDIATNATSGTPSDSEWNMTLTAVAGTYAPTVVTGFDSPSAIPAWYTKVAYRNSLTDAGNGATGANFTAKFDAYISLSQPAGSYTGKVKFVLIHPSIAHNPASSLCYNANGGEGAPECQNGEAGQTAGTYVHTLSSNTPHKFESVFLGWSEDPDATTATYQPGASLAFTKPTILYAVWRQADITNLLSGSSINVKIKNLANNTSNATYNTTDSTVTAFSRADSLPSGFTPSTANTISTSASTTPVYIFKDANDSGHIHYYSQADIIYANANSSRMFQNLRSLATISGLSDLDTSKVTNMSSMFSYAGRNATSWSVGNLSSWDTSKVTNMSSMFAGAGYSATNSFSLNLSGWNTSSVTNMKNMFDYAGYSATNSFSLNLSGWNTSSVTNMSSMFSYAGYSATSWSVGNLSSWDTSSVTSMSFMFTHAGYTATSWSVGNLSSWDTSSVTSMSFMFCQAGYSATDSFSLNLSGWNASSVTDMSSMFAGAGYSATNSFSLNLSGWNASSVTNMSSMFSSAGYSATNSFSLNLSGWNTSSVTNMSSMFAYAGYTATSWSVGNLSSWDTSSVTNMSSMFSYAGYSATSSFSLNLSGWNTSSVTNISFMFESAGYNATNFSLNLSDWDTSKVTTMTNMFSSAGRNATSWSVTIPSTNGGDPGINNSATRLYGSTSSKYAAPPSDRTFTIQSN